MIEFDKIKTLIPHSGKMVLLSRILNYDMDENTLQAEYDITPDCVFYDHNLGGVPSFVGFEFAAQSACSLLGARECLIGLKPKPGFLLSVSMLKTEIPIFKNNSTIKIHIKEIDHTDAMHTFHGEIFLEDISVLKGKIMTIEVTEEEIKNLNIEGILK